MVINDRSQDITINVTVDNYPYEASWNVYDYQQNSYIYTENFTFSENYESQTLELNLTSEYRLIAIHTVMEELGSFLMMSMKFLLNGSVLLILYEANFSFR